MLKIKLTRIGKKGVCDYRIVVAEAKSKNNGQYTALLGTYQPQAKPAWFKIDRVKLEYWLKSGAKPTPTISKLIAKHGKAA